MTTKVLVVDDALLIRSQVSRALRQLSGVEVIEATDGLDALEKLDGHGDVALVISDVNMPRMDGVELLQRIKANPQHANTVVVMLTTEGQPDIIARAKSYGAKGWIQKPFKADVVLAVVTKLAKLQPAAS